MSEFRFHRGYVTGLQWCPYEGSMLLSCASDNQLAVRYHMLMWACQAGWLAGYWCNCRCIAAVWGRQNRASLTLLCVAWLSVVRRGGGAA